MVSWLTTLSARNFATPHTCMPLQHPIPACLCNTPFLREQLHFLLMGASVPRCLLHTQIVKCWACCSNRWCYVTPWGRTGDCNVKPGGNINHGAMGGVGECYHGRSTIQRGTPLLVFSKGWQKSALRCGLRWVQHTFGIQNKPI